MRTIRSFWPFLVPSLFLPLVLVSRDTVPAAAAEEVSVLDRSLQPGEPTDRTPEYYQGSFLDTSVEAMLERLQVSLNSEDKVYAFPDPKLGIGSELRVYRAQAVLIIDGNEEHLVRTWAPTVADLAEEQHLDLADKDVVEPDRESLLLAQTRAHVVRITRVSEAELKVTSVIEFSRKVIDDPELERGQQEVEQKGQTGSLLRTYLVRRENGKEVSRKEISRTVTKEPVQEVVRRGTKVVEYGRGGASWYGGVPEGTAAHRTLPMGTRVRVVNQANGKSVVVRIADRGPFIDGRIIDLSKDAFAAIAPLGSGVANVRLEKE